MVLFVAYGIQFSFGVFAGDVVEDTGWYIGARTQKGEPEFHAVPARSVIERRPELGPVLEVPHGYLVLMHDRVITSIVDTGTGTAPEPSAPLLACPPAERC